jgi:hypothetical protein
VVGNIELAPAIQFIAVDLLVVEQISLALTVWLQ